MARRPIGWLALQRGFVFRIWNRRQRVAGGKGGRNGLVESRFPNLSFFLGSVLLIVAVGRHVLTIAPEGGVLQTPPRRYRGGAYWYLKITGNNATTIHAQIPNAGRYAVCQRSSVVNDPPFARKRV